MSNFTQIEANLRAQFSAAIPRALKKMGDAVVALIRQRTSQGRFLEGSHGIRRHYGQYEADYAKRRKGGRMSPVTLIDSGAMLGSLGVVEEPGFRFESAGRGSRFQSASGQWAKLPDNMEVSIGWADPAMAQRARYHDSAADRHKMPRRHFLGLTEAESRDLFNKHFVSEVQADRSVEMTKPTTLTLTI